jgi:hypothetical protein
MNKMAVLTRKEDALERRRGLARALHSVPLPLDERLARLRATADAYRTQAILLDAKLRMLESANNELHGVREKLLDSAAKLDTAVDAICALPRRASPRP